jgi:hypothetical protein
MTNQEEKVRNILPDFFYILLEIGLQQINIEQSFRQIQAKFSFFGINF